MILEGNDRIRAESMARKFHIEFEDDAVFVGIHEEKELLGFACAEIGETAVLKFIFVEARHRKKGIAPKLLEAFFSHAKRMGITTVEAECTSTGQAAAETYSFLSRHGFESVSRDMALYTVPLGYIIQWGEEHGKSARPINEITRWCDVPLALQNWCIADMKKRLAHYLLPVPWLGKRVDDLSFCYISNGELKANITVTETLGQLCLESLYCKKGYELVLYQLLLIASKGCSKYQDKYDLIKFICITEASNHIFLHISKGWSYEETHLWFMKCEI